MTSRIDVQRFDPDDAAFERLLREFYAAELRAAGAAPPLATRDARAGAASGRSRRSAAFVGLTVAAAVLALAVLAFAPRASESDAGPSQTAEASAGGGSNAGVATGLERVEAPGGRIERQGRERSGEPVRMGEPDAGYALDLSFPELDIRIIPIPRDDRPPEETERPRRKD